MRDGKGKMNKEQMEYIIERVVNNALEANREARENTSNEFLQGKSLAYYEILDTIKNQLEIYDQDLKDYSLDLDLEKEMWIPSLTR